MSFFLYLASASPRRAQLLEQLGIKYEIFPQDIDESINDGEDVTSFVSRLAREKAEQGKQNIKRDSDYPVLGADTIVTFDNHILGKPENTEQAINMLKLLSGQTHQVITAIQLCNKKHSYSAINKSEVVFRKITEQEINGYCQTGEPLDKAGSYAIQGLAAKFIANINGSYSGIMGLPLYETSQLIERFKY
ncbi:MAG: septum formation inhibitor Maf [Gammaproteobacteria bacterium]|nr:septum formation inhibitor Maf [Gammaproteobacteria bacterium]